MVLRLALACVDRTLKVCMVAVLLSTAQNSKAADAHEPDNAFTALLC